VPSRLGNPEEGNTSPRSLEWIFSFVRDLEINSGIRLEYLMFLFQKKLGELLIQVPYWNAMNLM